MNLSRCSMKKIRELIVFTAFLVVALWKFDVVIEVLKSIWKIVFPFALGGAIAFVINVPMSFLEKKMLGKIGDALPCGVPADQSILPCRALRYRQPAAAQQAGQGSGTRTE